MRGVSFSASYATGEIPSTFDFDVLIRLAAISLLQIKFRKIDDNRSSIRARLGDGLPNYISVDSSES